MARAYSIHIITHHREGEPIIAFTVKHECASWLEQQPPGLLLELHVVTFGDGRGKIRDYQRADLWLENNI
jgi:hypothetical protein